MSDVQLAAVGALLADRTRAALLTTLMGGTAHTSGELARHVDVRPSTASEHLGRLLDAGMVVVEPQGRHRYFSLADPAVAELLERLGAAPVPAPTTAAARVPAHLRDVRTCYDHLAGVLAVRIYRSWLRAGHLVEHDQQPRLTSSGATWLAGVGVDVAARCSPGRPIVRRCVDWSERRHHLAGAAGAALLDALLANRWVVRGHRPRALGVTRAGRQALDERLCPDQD